MKPDTFSVFNLFERQRRYVVPLYQRQYVWGEDEQWAPLWEDIQTKAEESLARDASHDPRQRVTNHFLGAVVLSQVPRFGRELAAYEVIDGQQRLTTLQIFLASLRDVCESEGDDADLAKTLRDLTRNEGMVAGEHERFKVWPTNADRDAFQRVMSAGSAEAVRQAFPLSHAAKDAARPRLPEAYLFFTSRIREFAQSGAADAILASGAELGVGRTASDRLFALVEAVRDRLQVVHIELEEGDDPQVIFETLNARGMPLLPSDLVRNFLFLRAGRNGEDIEHLYETYWRDYDEAPEPNAPSSDAKFWKVEERQGRLERPRIDLFLFHYLAFRKQGDVAIGHLFQEFRAWYIQNNAERDPVESELQSLKMHAAAFRKLFERDEQTRLGVFASRLRVLDTSTVYPVLLYLLGEGAPRLAPGSLDTIVTHLESFLVRRMISGLTPKNYNLLFRQLLRAMAQAPVLTPDIVADFLRAGTGDAVRWPADGDFARELLSSALYTRLSAAKLNMFLQGINRALYSDRQETLPQVVDKLEIEHVLPQGWEEEDYPIRSAEVAAGGIDLDPRQHRQTALHTLGNLTLLTQRLNKEVSNGPFSGKRGAIASQSTLLMNAYFQPLADTDVWDERAILKRGVALAEVAQRVWPYPATLN